MIGSDPVYFRFYLARCSDEMASKEMLFRLRNPAKPAVMGTEITRPILPAIARSISLVINSVFSQYTAGAW